MTAEEPSTAGTVYVVDDDASMRKALERMFRSAGFAVETFADAAAFLEHDRHADPCCAVFDVRMPALDGLTLHERLTAVGRALPVVFITGYGEVSTGVRAMKKGAIDFIEKPFTAEDLLASVRAAIDASHERRLVRAKRVVLESRMKLLTPREREVFALVAQGLPNKLIAARLGASEKTIKVHRGRVMDKMAARSLAELVRMADELGLTT